jgi:hypothetical protein
LKKFKNIDSYVKIDKALADALGEDQNTTFLKGDVEKKYKEILKKNGNEFTKSDNKDDSKSKSNSNIQYVLYNSKKDSKFNKFASLLPTEDILAGNENDKTVIAHFQKWNKDALDNSKTDANKKPLGCIFSINIINTIKHHITELKGAELYEMNAKSNKELIKLFEILDITEDDWLNFKIKNEKIRKISKKKLGEKEHNSEKKEKKEKSAKEEEIEKEEKPEKPEKVEKAEKPKKPAVKKEKEETKPKRAAKKE